MRSKFYGIRFPIFTLAKAPIRQEIRGSKLFIQPRSWSEDSLMLVDDVSLEMPYNKRLEALRTTSYNVIQYDYTCTTLSALLLSKSRWGYDSSNKTHFLDESYREYRMSYRKVTKISKTAFWVDRISYPFELPANLVDLKDLKNLWVGMVYVDFCWHIYDFSPFYKRKDRIKL